MHGSGASRFLSPLCKQGTTSPRAHLSLCPVCSASSRGFCAVPRNLCCQKHEDDLHVGRLGLSDCSLSSSPLCSLIYQDVIVSSLIKSFLRSQRVQRRREGGIFLSLEAVAALNNTDKNFVQAVHLSSLRPSENRINPPQIHLELKTVSLENNCGNWQDCLLQNCSL